MRTVALEEAQTHLAELIEQLKPGQEIVITRDQKPVARLTFASLSNTPRKLGTLKGTVLHVSPDFDAPLDVFEDYEK